MFIHNVSYRHCLDVVHHLCELEKCREWMQHKISQSSQIMRVSSSLGLRILTSGWLRSCTKMWEIEVCLDLSSTCESYLVLGGSYRCYSWLSMAGRFPRWISVVSGPLSPLRNPSAVELGSVHRKRPWHDLTWLEECTALPHVAAQGHEWVTFFKHSCRGEALKKWWCANG